MDFQCQKCKLPLGNMEKGKIRNGAAMLCRQCWAKAEAAINMAELVSSQSKDWLMDEKNPFEQDKTVQDLMGMFGMKGRKS
jgi:hypothetical protein